MVVFGRILASLAVLFALPFHALVPALQVASFTNPRIYDIGSGADPLITSYIDAGLWPALLLAASTVCLIGTLIGVIKGERWAASLVFLAAVADAFSLHLVRTLSLIDLPLTVLQIVGLGGGMVALFLLVRAVTKPV
ncbi:MAG: hypothetical protein AAGG79_01890 [Pseudomonadota bacterium]